MTPEQLLEKLALKRIVPEPQATELAGISVTHLRRLRKHGLAPRHISLGQRRIGYQISDVLAWIDARACDPAA